MAVKAIRPPKIIEDFVEKYEGTNEQLSRDSDFPSFDITTKVDTSIFDICEQLNVIKQNGTSSYCLVVRSDFNFEVNVYKDDS